ncbi:MAG: hypothetical protein LBP23_09140 [Treponema sp.]|jgi:hypothetical protein|nr:hypothetical protein [Treponema sp.]
MNFRLILKRVYYALPRKAGGVIPVLLFCAALPAAAVPPAPEGDLFPFPLVPLMETVRRGGVSWRPDWPPAIPPDAFSLSAARAGREGLRSVSLASAPALRAAWDAEGRLCEFPHFWRGAFYRTGVRYDAGGTLRGLRLSGLPVPQGPAGEGLGGGTAVSADGAAGDPAPAFECELELPGGDGAPFVVRSGDRVFWVVVTGGAGGMDGGGGSADGGGQTTHGGGGEAAETWYDAEGNFRALVTYRFAGDGGAAGRIVSLEIRGRWAESYDYCGGGGMSRVASSGGVYTALYGEKGPLYRSYTPAIVPVSAAGSEEPPVSAALSGAAAGAAGEGPPGAGPEEAPVAEAQAAAPFPAQTDFQWDERGFLVLLRNWDAGGAFAGEFRYEYETGGGGDWILRREFEMVRQSGVLVPVFRGALRRVFTQAETGS